MTFRASSDFYGMFGEPEYHSVSLDTHEYQCFGAYWNELAEKPEGWGTHLTHSCNFYQQFSSVQLVRVVELLGEGIGAPRQSGSALLNLKFGHVCR